MKCPKCGKEVAAGTKFCIGCGSPLPQEEPKASAPAPAPKPVKVELPDESGVIQDKGTLIFWLTLLCGSTNIHHFMLAKTGGPLDKKSRFVFNWEGLVTVAFAVLALIITVASQSAVVGTVLLGMLSIAAFVHAWRHAFGKIYSYDHTHHYMGQKWKKVVCIVHASVTVISIILALVLSSLAPKAEARAKLSVMVPAVKSWETLQEAYVAESRQTGDFEAIGFSAPSDENVAFFEISSAKRKDVRAIGAMLMKPLQGCPEKMTLVRIIQVDPHDSKIKKHGWVGVWNTEDASFQQMPDEQIVQCMEYMPEWEENFFPTHSISESVEKFEYLLPPPLFEPLDMSEISKFLETARANEPQTEGDGFYLSSFVATLGKVMKALSPDVQEIDAKTFQTQNFIYKEESRNKRKNKVIWTAKSLRPVGECPEGSEWKITATQKPTRGEGMAFNYGYYVKSPEGCPKVKDLKETILSEW